jgi:hypothetical protein
VTPIRFPTIALTLAPFALALSTSACAGAGLEPAVPRHTTLSMPYARPGCLAMRGPLSRVMILIDPAPRGDEPREKPRPVEEPTILAIAARLRALPPSSAPADEGAARTIAFLDRIASGPLETLGDRIAEHADEGRQLLAAVTEACKMPSLTRGTLDRSAVRDVTLPNLRRCFDLGSHPFGVMLITLLIERDGAVSSAYPAAKTLGDASLASCIARSFEDVRFPRPEGGVATMTLPLRVR